MNLVFHITKTFMLSTILLTSFSAIAQKNNSSEVASLKEELLRQQELLVEIIKNQDSIVKRNAALYNELMNINIPSESENTEVTTITESNSENIEVTEAEELNSKNTEVAAVEEVQVDLYTREIISFDRSHKKSSVN